MDTLCRQCQKKKRQPGSLYCGKTCDPKRCSVCGSDYKYGTCPSKCNTCNKHTGTITSFGECSSCRVKRRSRQSLAAKKAAPKPVVQPSVVIGLEAEIVELQKKNAKLEDRMADMEAQMALIIESVSEICTRNLEQMEEDLG